MSSKMMLFLSIILFFYTGGSAFADTLSISDTITVSAVVETVFIEDAQSCAYGHKEILSFANQLYNLADYERASVEYLRYAFLYPDKICSRTALFRAAICKERAQYFEQARLLYYQLRMFDDERTKSFAQYRIPLTYFLQDKLDSALFVIDSASSGEAYGALEYLRGWIFLKQNRYDDALSVFEMITRKAEDSDLSGSLNYLNHRSRQGRDIPHRSPFIAALMSAFVPGLGRGYCGRWGDGFFSFIVVGAPAGLAAYMWESDRTFAVIMATAAAFFEVGNIYGSAKGASVYNSEKQKIFWKTTWDEVPHPPTVIYSELPCEEDSDIPDETHSN